MTGSTLSPSEIWVRAQTGPKTDLGQYNFKILSEITGRLVKEHDIEIARDSILPIDNSLADAIYRAGYEFLLENGIYCSDTHRMIRITEEELKDGIRNAPKEVTVGEGKDAVKVAQRRVGDSARPVISSGGAAIPLSEEIFVKAIQSYAQQPLIDMTIPGTLFAVEGHHVVARSQYETKAAKLEVMMTRIACALAGRRGMALEGPHSAVTPQARIAATEGGLRPSDLHQVSIASELKIDVDFITVLADWLGKGNLVFPEAMPIFGGYLGGSVEKVAVLDVAAHLATFALFSGSIHDDGPVHVRWGCTTTRETMQVIAHAGVAVDRNTDALTATMIYPKAGPSTEDIFIEMAAQTMADTVSGREMLTGVGANGGVVRDHVDGILGRAMAEISVAAANMSTSQANEAINILLAEYDNKEYYKTAPEGKRFQECYDVMAIKPTQEHLNVYEKAMEKIEKETGLRIL